jgi:GcrA cell cycle regulator
MEWTDERTNLLRTLWLQGQTASQIAERLGGVTRNAVIGKAHRLGLSSRPSPIRQRPAGRPAHQPAPPSAPRSPIIEPAAPAVAAAPLPQPVPAPAPTRTAKAAPGSRACMWPVGDPKQPGFHFCGAPAEPSRPYCAQHCSVAYHRKADAAA